jgi:hypothetical protein
MMKVMFGAVHSRYQVPGIVGNRPRKNDSHEVELDLESVEADSPTELPVRIQSVLQ